MNYCLAAVGEFSRGNGHQRRRTSRNDQEVVANPGKRDGNNSCSTKRRFEAAADSELVYIMFSHLVLFGVFLTSVK